jgi:hypothetical protein
MIALRLAKAGYGGGNPERVLKMRADMVMSIVQYEGFVADYERAYIELNKG